MGYSDTINNIYGVIERRKAEERQAMLDELNRKQLEHRMRVDDDQLKTNQMMREAQAEASNALALHRTQAGLYRGQELDPATVSKLGKLGGSSSVLPGSPAVPGIETNMPSDGGMFGAVGQSIPDQPAGKPKYAGSPDEQQLAEKEAQVDRMLANDPEFAKLDTIRKHVLRNLLITGQGSSAGIFPDAPKTGGRAYVYDEETNKHTDLGPVQGATNHYYNRNRFKPDSGGATGAGQYFEEVVNGQKTGRIIWTRGGQSQYVAPPSGAPADSTLGNRAGTPDRPGQPLIDTRLIESLKRTKQGVPSQRLPGIQPQRGPWDFLTGGAGTVDPGAQQAVKDLEEAVYVNAAPRTTARVINAVRAIKTNPNTAGKPVDQIISAFVAANPEITEKELLDIRSLLDVLN